MNESFDIDDLRRAAEQPLEMRGNREDELLASLLQDLTRSDDSAIDAPVVADRLIHLDFDAVRMPLRPRRRSFVTSARAAAIAVVLGGIAIITISARSTDQAPTPGTSPNIPAVAQYETVERACEAFAAGRPDFSDAFVSGDIDIDAVDDLLALYERTLAEISLRFDVESETLAAMQRARGSIAQMAGAARTVDGAYANLLIVDTRLNEIATLDNRFALCTLGEATTR